MNVKKREFKDQVSNNFLLARLIGNQISKILDAENKIEIIKEWDLFPSLFTEEQKEFEEKQAIDELERFKDNRRFMIARHNNMIKQNQKTN